MIHEKAEETLQQIFGYLTRLSALRDFDEILEVLADMARSLTHADRCSVWVVSDDKRSIYTKVAHGTDTLTLPMGSGIVGHAIKVRESVIINDVYADERFNPEIDRLTGYTTYNMMVIPMHDNEGEVIGAFQVINSIDKSKGFTEEDMQRLLLASTFAAETIVSARLTQEIEETQREVVFTMGAIGESRSKETGNHVKRVAEYSKILALGAGLPKEEAELLKQASPMHDIGKIAIPDEVLKKPAGFTKSEREVMQRHAQLGYEMIKDSSRPLLKAAAIVAYEHHEKWDGSGYPRGLKGEEIHIYGRITALADVFDALGSDRVYKKAWPIEKILSMLKEERGRHFDPKLVDVFFEHLDEILEVRERFGDTFEDDENQKKPSLSSIRVLGAYGTKLKGFGTSSFLLNDANVIDAGNLLEKLEEFSVRLEHVWLTHSHLDHIVDIAYVLDNYYDRMQHPLVICGRKETLDAVKKHFLNDLIWPDFSKIALKNAKGMCVEYKEVHMGKRYAIGERESIEAFETDHTVPSCGYIYEADGKAVLITADTYDLYNVLELLERRKEITAAVIECSFPSSMSKLAKESKHLTPKLLYDALKDFGRKDEVKFYINHIKPIYINRIIEEIEELFGNFDIEIVTDGKILNF